MTSKKLLLLSAVSILFIAGAAFSSMPCDGLPRGPMLGGVLQISGCR